MDAVFKSLNLDKVEHKGKLSTYDRDSLAWNYHVGFTVDQLAKEYGVDRTSVVYWGKRRNILGKETLHRNKLTKLKSWDKDLVAWNYYCGYSSNYIANQYGIDRTRVWQILKEKNVVIHRVDINETVFDVITEKSAYWLGFLITDGCVIFNRSKNTHVVEVCLSSKDVDHLKKLRVFMESNAKISINSTRCTISFTSEKLFKMLSNYGIVEHKTFLAKVPIGLEHNSDFWRGAIDGDGCIYRGLNTGRKTYGVHFCGTKEMVVGFSKYVESICGKRPTVKRTKENLYESRIQSKLDVYKVLCKTYENSKSFLNRKHQLALDIIHEVRFSK